MDPTQEKLAALEHPRRELMEFLLATLPASDRYGYPFELFLEFVDHALMLRATMPWCAALTEEDFRQYVLYPRVNDEDISSHRPLFYELVIDKVRGLPVEEAILEINRWCQSHVSYQLQDDRTASPRTVYTAGSGRCGEQSTFMIAVLRSVGIAARQVYAQWWSHCDDNHAWVEGLCDGRWRFFGGCEPEPVLDRGWFTAAATRAMVVRSRRFGSAAAAPSLISDGPPLGREGTVQFYSQAARYGKTRWFRFRVTQNGAPVAGARIKIGILNEADYRHIGIVETDPKGQVRVELGLGDIHLCATHQGLRAEAICHGAHRWDVELPLAPPMASANGEWTDFEFDAPADAPVNLTTLSPDQRLAWRSAVEKGTQHRLARIEGFYDEARAAAFPEEVQAILRAARGNFENIYAFLTEDDDPLRPRLLANLNDKDYRDATPAMLNDHLAGAKAWAGHYPDEVFDRGLLRPRIAIERLTPWRGVLAARYTAEQQDAFRKDPALLWQALCSEITVMEEDTHPGIFWPPEVTLAAGCCNAVSLPVAMVALLRAMGVPARLSPRDRATPEYWRDGAWHPVQQRPTAPLTLTYGGGEALQWGLNWTLARWEAGAWRLQRFADDAWQNGRLIVELPAGEYRLLTTTRLPGGNQFASECHFPLATGEARTVALRLREYQLSDALIHRDLLPFHAADAEGRKTEFPGAMENRCRLMFWLEEGAEPTEHVLNELAAAKDQLQALPVDILFFMRDEKALEQTTLAALLADWPEIQLYFGEWEYNRMSLANHYQVSPSTPPLSLVCDITSHVVYAFSGYNVNMVDLMARIVSHLTEGA